MLINSHFDGGNIEVISAENPQNIQLNIRKDYKSNFFQWFYFSLTDKKTTKKNEHYRIFITNAHLASYAEGWQNYQAVASYDRKEWFRIDTKYDGQNLILQITPEHNTVYFAFFPPYSYERHQDLIAKAQSYSHCSHEILGSTIEGRSIDLLKIGIDTKSNHKKKYWIIARQHSGETMAEWYCEGLINKLLAQNDIQTNQLLDKCIFYIIPNMNPDGSVLGNLRANGAGIDMNRQWQSPDKDKTPEVYFTKQKMQNTGVDFFLDVHGDETRPYIYTLNREGTHNYNNHIQQLEKIFKDKYQEINPDFQSILGYTPNGFSREVLITLASPAVGEIFDCLAFTIELPFYDNEKLPDKKYGWSIQRSIKLGEDLVAPLLEIVKG